MTISVVGVGVVTEPADLMTLELGVTTSGATVHDATSRATERISLVTAEVLAVAGDAINVATTRYNVYPEHHRDGGPPRRYVADHVLSATLRDVRLAGEVLEAATRAAGDSAQIHGLKLSLDETAERVGRARDAAWNDARDRAQHLAQLAGRPLGRASRITEQRGPQTPVPLQMRAALESAPVPMERGEADVVVALDVVFEFDD